MSPDGEIPRVPRAPSVQKVDRGEEARRSHRDRTAETGLPLPAGDGRDGRQAWNAGRSLYETDFYSWTARQAAALRGGAFREADIANIVEEIETLGRSEEAALESSYVVLCTHLLKAIYQPERTSQSWRASVLNSRLAIAKLIRRNPGLKPKRDAAFREAYADARKIASLETGLAIARLPVDPPFARDRAEAEDYLPGGLDESGADLGPRPDGQSAP